MLKVKSKMVCPVQQSDGTWTTVVKEFIEDIPDLGRHTFICNKCKTTNYPDCISKCIVEKHWRDYKPEAVE